MYKIIMQIILLLTAIENYNVNEMSLTEWRASESRFQRPSHGKVAAIRQWSLYQTILDAQVFETIQELSVCHVDC